MTVIMDHKRAEYSLMDYNPGLQNVIDTPGVFRGIAEVMDTDIIDISENPCI